FDLPTYWQRHLQSFVNTYPEYCCTLHIHPDRMSFVKWLLAGRWEIITDPDDMGWVTGRLKLDSELLAKRLFFGLAEVVEVIEAPELQASVLAQAQALLDSKKLILG